MNLATYLNSAPRGTARAIARGMDVSPVMVAQWAAGTKTPPDDRCVGIERHTAGAVTCEELRPDLGWVRVTAPDWPWHPNGKPLLDLTAAAQQDTRQAA